MNQENEQLIRKVNAVGNGAHVFVPKEWIGNRVVLIREPEKSLKEKILKVIEPYLENILGVYLYGSYARGEQEEDSDIDLFIITNKKIKIKGRNFEIVSLKKEDIGKAIKINPTFIFAILSEARTIINEDLLNELKQQYKLKKEYLSEFIKDNQRLIKINRDFLKLEENVVEGNAVSYSAILRARGIFIVNRILAGKSFSKREFIDWLKNVLDYKALNLIYRGYESIKKDSSDKFNVGLKDMTKLIDFIDKENKKLKENLYGKKK